MRPTESAVRPRLVGTRRRLTASVVASALILGGGLLGVPAALADEHDDRPALPTRGEVQQARTDAQEAANRVAEIQAALVAANAELESAAVRAEQAFEAYNGARWAADQAREELAQAVADATRAERVLARQRDQLAGLIAVSYQDGGGLTALDAVLGAQGPQGVMDQLLAYEGASTSMDAQLQRYAATADLADVFRAEAAAARREKLRLLDEAESAKDVAVAAAASAQAVAESVAAQKTELLAELARLQGISVQLAEQRQTALEEIARIEAQEAAEQAAREAARRAAQQAEEAQQTDGAEEQPEPTTPEQPAETEDPAEPVDDPPAPSPPPPPAPDPSPPAPAGGAASAIAFAKAQVGEPYVWGAAGPDSWDCSGLTMGAWQAGGVALPHYSVAQYDAATPIGASQLRPGDLVFWGTSSSPGSIHHVAMYLGDGMIVHAPRTGRPVTVESMYYWVPPNFFGRV